jgi:hypothetical protein
MNDPELDRYAKLLGLQRPDTRRLVAAAHRSADGARIAKSVLRAKLRRAGVNPDDVNPFRPALSAEDLGGSGAAFAFLADGGPEFVWRHDEIRYSAIFTGAPGMGKTTEVIRLLIQLSQKYPVIVPDVRGDYECLCRYIPNVRFFVFGSFPINLLRGPGNVPPAVFNQRFSEVFTEQFGLFQSSRRYLNLVLDCLEAKRVETGHWPSLPDLQDALESRKEQRGSDGLQFRNRCLARVDALCRGLGEKSIGVERGIVLEQLIAKPQIIIFRIELERSLQDFLVNWLLSYVFEYKTCREDKFNQDPLIFVMDEQRSILRRRR